MLINFGLIGTLLLMLLMTSLITPFKKHYVPLNLIASILLMIHAIMIKDIYFIFINGYISLTLIVKSIQIYVYNHDSSNI